MSLINDALKKAQNQRAGLPPIPGPTPAPPKGAASVPTTPRKGKTPVSKSILIGVTASLLCALISIAATLYILKEDAPPAPLPPAMAAVSPVVAPAPAAVVPVNAPLVTAPIAPGVATEPAPIVMTPPPAPLPTITAPSAATVSAAATKQTAARIQSFIARLRVNSIRISEGGNKAIINERLFRTGDVIEPSLGLKLVGIENGQLTFVDEAGNQYFRHF